MFGSANLLFLASVTKYKGTRLGLFSLRVPKGSQKENHRFGFPRQMNPLWNFEGGSPSHVVGMFRPSFFSRRRSGGARGGGGFLLRCPDTGIVRGYMVKWLCDRLVPKFGTLADGTKG